MVYCMKRVREENQRRVSSKIKEVVSSNKVRMSMEWMVMPEKIVCVRGIGKDIIGKKTEWKRRRGA